MDTYVVHYCAGEKLRNVSHYFSKGKFEDYAVAVLNFRGSQRIVSLENLFYSKGLNHLKNSDLVVKKDSSFLRQTVTSNFTHNIWRN